MRDSTLPRADSPAELGFRPERLARMGEIIRGDVRRRAIPGAVVLILRDGQVAFHEAFGFEQAGEPAVPMRRDSAFRIAAMSRPIAVAAALALAEDGLLSLTDPVERYLPEFGRVQVGTEEAAGTPRARLVLQRPLRAMTVHDLMRHTSGLTYGMFGDSLVQRLYREAAVMDPGQSNATMVSKLAELPLQCQPGSTFEYGMSTDVLGRVMEVAAGEDLASVIERRVTGPLAMRNTGFRLIARPDAGLAQPRRDAGSPRPVLFDYDPSRPPAWCSAGAGLLSTAEDYARFCQMLLDGGALGADRILSRKSVDLMLANHLPRGIAYGASTPGLGINAPTPEQGQGHGLGVGVRLEAGRCPVPGSIDDFFWGGALGTYFWADPRERLAAVLMLQENDIGVRAHYRSLLRHVVYGALSN